MKRWLKISCLGVVILALAGCSNGDKKKEDNIVTSTSQTEQSDSSEKEKDNLHTTDLPQGDQAEDVIIVLDAGHGGSFIGASYDGFIEKDLTLKIAKYVKEYLEENYTGMELFLVREQDENLSEDVKEDLELRAQYAQDVNADVLVSLHFNASEDHTQQGSMVLVSQQENVTEASKELANSILDELKTLGFANNGSITRDSNDMLDENGKPLDYYAINRHCAIRDIPGIIVEHCFMDNEFDKQFFDSEEDLRALAKADAIGIAKYYGLVEQ